MYGDGERGNGADGVRAAAPAESEPTSQVTNLDIIDRVAADGSKSTAPLPFALRVLVAAAVNPAVDAPACIILPDVEGVAEVVAALAALVALKEDWPKLEETFFQDVLRPGVRLRSLKNGKVIAFCGMRDGLAQLHYVDAEGSKTNASLFVQKNVMLGLEPTQRKRPIFKSGEKPEAPLLTPFDAAGRTRTFANTGMIRKCQTALEWDPLSASKRGSDAILVQLFIGRRSVWPVADRSCRGRTFGAVQA